MLTETLSHDHLSVIAALTPTGTLFQMQQARAFTGEEVVRFLKHLLRHLPGKLQVIWDGASIHRSRAVKDFLRAGAAARLRLVQLPGSAPELNPVDGLWHYLKGVELKNVCCRNLAHLRRELGRAIARVRHYPALMQTFVRQPGCY